MLFNSFVFLLAFLPLALALHWGAERFAPSLRLPVLVALSFAFYGYWDWRFLPLLAFSIGLNWLIAEAFQKTRAGGLVTLAIVLNLAVVVTDLVVVRAFAHDAIVGSPQRLSHALIAHCVVLAVATVLSTFKPFGTVRPRTRQVQRLSGASS